jgi:ribosomal protein S18 acetylase RimI-like enzyme
LSMTRLWLREEPARWDAPKARIVGGAPAGIFDTRFQRLLPGDLMPGTWWRVEDGGRIVGFGWMDVVWGDAEILLAVDPEAQRHGVGRFILEQLEREASERGLNYMYNLVRPTHPQREALTAWMLTRGFTAAEDGSLLRAVNRH